MELVQNDQSPARSPATAAGTGVKKCIRQMGTLLKEAEKCCMTNLRLSHIEPNQGSSVIQEQIEVEQRKHA